MSKTFTQEELNKIVNDRLASEKKKFDDYKANINAEIGTMGFKNFEEVKTLASERDTYKTKHDELIQEKELKEKRNQVKDLGVDESFIDFVLDKAPEGDYATFLEANPKLKAENFTKGASNPPYTGGGAKRLEDAESDAEYMRLRREKSK